MTTPPLPTAQLPDLPDERFPASLSPPSSASGGPSPTPPPAAEVPKTYASSFAAWWAQGDKHEELVLAEERLLRFRPLSPCPLSKSPVRAWK
jgi:hypothetical protein